MSKESTVKVSLDLNEELREYAVKRLAQFRTEHRDCAANVLCDLPQLNRELCGAICDHLNAIQYYGQTAAKARFAKVQAAVRTILADPTQKAALEAEYKSQTKYGSLFGYAMHKLNGQYDQNGDLING